MNRGNLDDAVNLALHAVASASVARDGDQAASQIASIASTLAFKKAPEKGELFYHQLWPVLQRWTVDIMEPLIQVQSHYVAF